MGDQFPELMTSAQEVSATELLERLEAGDRVTILDTRRPDDCETWRLAHRNVSTVNIPFTEFLTDDGEPAEEIPDSVPEGPLVTSCAKGISSLYVAEFLTQRGGEIEALDYGMQGWARLHRAREVTGAGEAKVLQYHRPSSGCLAYLVVSDGEAAGIDPLRAFASRSTEDAAEHDAALRNAIDTHVHADHVSGVREVAASSGARAVLPAGAAARGLEFDAVTVDDGDELPLGSTVVEAVHIPGHTSEMTGFRVGEAFLTGDTVFTHSVARPDLASGVDGGEDAGRRLHATLQAIVEGIPDETVIGPGHTSPGEAPAEDGTYTARLGDLRGSLAAFSQDRETFVEATLADKPPWPNNYREIVATNLARTVTDGDAVFELELGPNNYAATAD